jgi:RNA polymerase sigma-70 factor (ECF subfamily)
MSQNNEQELINACINGDAKAQKRLYDQYSKIMYGICLRYSYTREEAKDILQDGFIKVFTKMSQFGNTGSFEGWMKRVFVNAALQHYREHKKFMNESDVSIANNTAQPANIIENISRDEILNAMNELAIGYRTVMNLYVIEGYNHAEIAEMLGISEGTSKSQLSRARVLLQQLLAQKTHIHESR